MQPTLMKLAMATCSAIGLAAAAQAPPSAVKHAAAAAQAPPSAAKHQLAAAAKAEKAPPSAAKHHLAAAAPVEKVMPDIGSLMATSQTSLAQAEALYDKAVQGGKANFSKLLTTQAEAMAASIRTYAASLSKASAEVEVTVNATQVGAAAANSKQIVSFAEMDEVATLKAKVESLASEARRMERLRRSAQQRAVEKAVDQLEDAQGGGLGRKLGDLSTMSADATAIVQAAAPADEEASPPAAAVAAVAPKPAVKGPPASLAQLNKNIVAARATAKAEVATAEEQFATALSQAKAQLEAGANKIKAALAVAEKEEIDRVKAQKVDKEPLRPRHRHHRHHRHV